MSQYYTINQVTKILRVSAQTLRNWDKKGTLTPHHKSASGYRYYAKEDIDRMLGI